MIGERKRGIEIRAVVAHIHYGIGDTYATTAASVSNVADGYGKREFPKAIAAIPANVDRVRVGRSAAARATIFNACRAFVGPWSWESLKLHVGSCCFQFQLVFKGPNITLQSARGQFFGPVSHPPLLICFVVGQKFDGLFTRDTTQQTP